MANELVLSVRLGAAEFRRFAVFNTFRRRRAWVRPLLFALIFTGFSLISLLSGKEQGGLLGGVLLAVGLGLPLVYIGSFFSQVSAQIKRAKLKPPRLVYTVRLRRLGVHVQQPQGKDAEFPWDKLYAACRVRSAIYLYPAPEQAFLLPEGCGAPQDEIWEMLVRFMPEGKCHLYR
ncbi:MAG: hypothetical protein IJ573_02490 [Clostridia bacterium]|nr:hypothetical protein [Clostridia bacterium]